MEVLEAEKPSDDADDPRDVQAIEEAQKNLGDYALKSSPEYVVPPEKHINASQKRKQMLVLLESMHFIKKSINERVLELRETKRNVMEEVDGYTEGLNEIEKKLAKGQMHEMQTLLKTESSYESRMERLPSSTLEARQIELGRRRLEVNSVFLSFFHFALRAIHPQKKARADGTPSRKSRNN